MEKTLLSVKTDKKLKRHAQQAARELGLPLGTIVNAYLRDFVREKRVVFSTPAVPNKRTQQLLKKIAVDIQKKRNARGPFTYDEAAAYLDRL